MFSHLSSHMPGFHDNVHLHFNINVYTCKFDVVLIRDTCTAQYIIIHIDVVYIVMITCECSYI